MSKGELLMKIKLLIILLLLIVHGASASDVTINSNKNLVLDGVETFPISMSVICSYYWDTGHGLDTCAESFDKLNNFTIAFQLLNVLSADQNWAKQTVNDSKNHSMYWSAVDNVRGSTFSSLFLNDPYFQGWWLLPEEPSTPAQLDAVKAEYDAIKAYDPNHPVSLTTFAYTISGASIPNVSEAADIIVYDAYKYKSNCGSSVAFYYSGNCVELYYYLDEFIYAWEREVDQKFGKNLSKIPDPVYIHMTAYGDEWTEGSTIWKLKSKEQIRAVSYFAIVMGAKGISYWGNKIWPNHPTAVHGITINDTRAAYYNNFAGEIISDSIQNVLLLPILNSSWNGADTWDNKVVFGTNPTRKIYTTRENVDRNALAYAYKENGTTNKKYLIVVNKYKNPITTSVSISGLSGSYTVTTMGLESDPNSSSRAGRILAAINGNFTDTFDGYAAHVYEISSTNPAPSVASWGNTKTGDNNTYITLNASESVTFNATANQNITTWNWYKDGVLAGNTASSYNTSWDSIGGTKTIKVNATNSNGTSNTITWNVMVLPIASPKFGIGGATWDSVGTSSNVYIENNILKLGFWGENFDDGLYDWTTEYGNVTVLNGKLSMYGNTNAHASKIIGRHSDVAMFVTWTETNIDGLKALAIRSNTSLSSPDMNYWASARADGIGMWIVKYNGTDWVNVNGTGTFTRTPDATSYCIEKGYGGTFKVYCSHISYTDALASAPVSQGSDSAFASGDRIRLESSFNLIRGTDTTTFDNLRIISLDGSGIFIYSGSKTVHYDVGINNVTGSIIINATTPSNTNYTVSYRQKHTGSWVPIGGTYTGNQTLSIYGTRYQNTEINITLFGNGTSFPEIETVEFTREQVSTSIVYPRYDVNENGTVDINDLTLVGQYFNEVVPFPYPRYDVNMDGLVNIDDITIVGQHFGEKF